MKVKIERHKFNKANKLGHINKTPNPKKNQKIIESILSYKKVNPNSACIQHNKNIELIQYIESEHQKSHGLIYRNLSRFR
jgi:hypothetical protein